MKLLLPIFYMLGFLFKLKKRIYHSKKDGIVILNLHKIGDSLVTMFAIKAVRQKYPNREITVVSYSYSKPFLEEFVSDVNHVYMSSSDIAFNKYWIKRNKVKELISINPSVIITLSDIPLTISIILNLNPKKVYGMVHPLLHPFLDSYSVDSNTTHITQKYLRAINTWQNFDAYFNVDWALAENRTDVITINPFAGWDAKVWNMKKFVELYNELRKYYSVQFVFQQGQVKNDILDEFNRESIKYIETKTLDELINVIKSTGLFIGCDSGPIHMAALYGIPSLTIFGPTNPYSSKADRPYHREVRKVIKCSPLGDEQYCFTNAGRDGCPAFECMNQLTTEEVLKKSLDMAKEYID